MVRVFLFVLACSGCTDVVGFVDLPTAPLRPTLTEPFTDNAFVDNERYWNDEVEAGIEAWNAALVEQGCEPMLRLAITGEVAYPVILYAFDRWPDDDAFVGLTHGGELGDGAIHIRNRKPNHANLPTVVHELGHAIGLSHDETPGSVMMAKVGELDRPSDANARAACR